MMRRSTALACALFALAVLSAAGVAGAGDSSTYVQPRWFAWDRAELDVIIVPPNHGPVLNDEGLLGGSDLRELDPYENAYLRAIKRSVRAWSKAVRRFGPQWLLDAFRTRVYVAGEQWIPMEVALDPDIVILSDESKGVLLGFAAQTRPCIVNNSKMFVKSFTFADMYNVNAQEYGHCLGLGHSYGRPSDDSRIRHDVMYGRYGHDVGGAGNHRHCISNLNVSGLETVFGEVLGHPAAEAVTMHPRSYRRMSC